MLAARKSPGYFSSLISRRHSNLVRLKAISDRNEIRRRKNSVPFQQGKLEIFHQKLARLHAHLRPQTGQFSETACESGIRNFRRRNNRCKLKIWPGGLIWDE
jgi:hypothetical protein